MDDGTDVEDQNLVNDQVTEALSETSPAPGETVKPTAVTTPVAASDDKPAQVADDKKEEPEAFTAEAAPMNADAITAPAAKIAPEPEVAAPEPVEEEEPETPIVSPLVSGSGDDDELMEVKQKALEQLSPLVSHLDLPPDQKFDTYMEIIRASDDKSLIQPAFDAAQQIEDEDKKAQALLDVVNEVNYLTQDEADEE